MTGNPMKPRQKRLDGYVLPKPKRAIIGEKLGERACHNLKIAVFAGDGHRRLESTGENRQSRHNTMLLGEYRFIEIFSQYSDAAFQAPGLNNGVLSDAYLGSATTSKAVSEGGTVSSPPIASVINQVTL